VAVELDVLVPLGCTCYHAFTYGLSTCWSRRNLKRRLILGSASRLDAFSAYPNATSLPGTALGRTTGTQEVAASRSSRT